MKIGSCSKHPSENFVNCSLCRMEAITNAINDSKPKMKKEKYHLVPASWIKKQIADNNEHRVIFDENEENLFITGENSAYSEIKNLFPAKYIK